MTTMTHPPARNGYSRTHALPRRPLTERDLLRAFLADGAYPCPACSYNLQGIAHAACPECGMTLHLAVRGDRELAMPQLVRLLATALPLGFNVIFLMVGVVGAIFSRYWRDDDWLLMGMMLVAAGVFAGMLGFVLRTAAKFRRHPRRDQWMRAGRWVVIATIIQAAGIAMMFVVR